MPLLTYPFLLFRSYQQATESDPIVYALPTAEFADMEVSDSALPVLMFPAYYYIRHCLLHPYKGAYEDKIRKYKVGLFPYLSVSV